ncbi:hypothetical protein ABW20_dc0106080 [Dactylellina cionopaga]|nr:hypothetical protein ABW20_dc0106080 [Dactylellina cionopaga]
MGPDMVESTTSPLMLDDYIDDDEAFDMFVQHAYLDDYITTNLDIYPGPGFLLHARVYLLAEKLDAQNLKGKALQNARKIESEARAPKSRLSKGFLSDLVHTIPLFYSRTGQNDEFKALVARLCASFAEDLRELNTFSNTIKIYPDLATDILLHGSKCKAHGWEWETFADSLREV